jgi:hypothetical protein
MSATRQPVDEMIERLRELLAPVQERIDVAARTRWPAGAIVGCPRSGTTLLLQVLARSGGFAYPTNLLARFAAAPYVGALVQRLVGDPACDPRGEFAALRAAPDFASDLGKTRGLLGANEFQHFFRVQIPHRFPRWLTEAERDRVDCDWLAKGLASLEAVLAKPVVTKAGLLQCNLAHFDARIPTLLWLRVRRRPADVMRSILAARESGPGGRATWWSIQPREHAWLAGMDVFHQVAGQVFCIEHALSRELAAVPAERQLSIEYDELCRAPRTVVMRVTAALARLGCRVAVTGEVPESFAARTAAAVSAADGEALDAAYDDFSRERAGFVPAAVSPVPSA